MGHSSRSGARLGRSKPSIAACWLFALASMADSAMVERGPSSVPVLSAPLGSLPVSTGPDLFRKKAGDRFNPLAHEADGGRRGTWNRIAVPPDPLAERSRNRARAAPEPLLTFGGTGNPAGCGGCSPPDTVGDVGPHHYVQMVNATKVAVYDKTGDLLGGPFDLSTFWSSGACVSDYTDPVVVYDPLADRWVLGQLHFSDRICIAVSESADPLGAYHVYEFETDVFPDYFKLGVWPDGYYVSTNEDTYNAWVFEREAMLAGVAAQSQKATGDAENFLLPADLDGLAAPPAGAPGLFYTFLDDDFHGGNDRLELWEFHVDWAKAVSSTFEVVGSPILAPFTFTVCGFFDFNCARQPDTNRRLDVVSEWPMFRFAYRNFDSYESAVGTFTVGGGELGGPPNQPTNAGSLVRWFELRNSGEGWDLYQEGAIDPPDTHDRFMGSIAQDALGDIAIGYSISSKEIYPGIRYAIRTAADPPGALGEEAELQAGLGSQTGSNRWGDYSAMSIDPADDCTFWFTSEYYAATASTTWSTRVGAFRIPDCNTLFFDGFETGGSSRWTEAVDSTNE